MFDSDFNIRLATLAALGGDTSVTFDSVYSIDLEILKLTSGGGGGGMNYNAIKAALAASGVTEILFNDGDSSVTLDYEKVMQIGQGGSSNYLIVDTVDELSGVTAQDGMVAYLKEHDATEERMVLRMDFYGGWNDLRIAYNDGNTLTLQMWENGHATSFGGNAKYYKYGDGNSDTMNDHQSDLPQDFTYNANGAIGTYVSMEEGDEYSTNGDYKNTFYFKKYDGTYPTITWEPAGECTTVSSSLTTENITVHYTEKGWYKYYANVSGGTWLPYEIMWDSLDVAEQLTVINQFATYKKPLKVHRNVNSYGNSVREFNAIAYSTDLEHPDFVNNIRFFANTANEPSADIKLPNFGYSWNSDEQKWETNGVGFETIERGGTGYRAIREYAVQIPNANSEYFANPNTIYNIPISGVVSGTVYSTEIVADLTDHNWDEYCFKFNNGWNGFDCWFSIRKDGYIRTECGSRLVIPAEVLNPNGNEWIICNYAWQDEANSGNGAYAVAGVRMLETTANTYLVQMFVSTSADGYQDMYSTEFNSEKSYVWTSESGQTMELQPMIYQFGIIAKQSRVFFDKSMKTVVMTQQEYEALSVKDNNTIYYTTSN